MTRNPQHMSPDRTNWNEVRGERNVGLEYLQGFRHDLTADARMLQTEIDGRSTQLANANAVLRAYDGQPVDVSEFLQAYYAVLY